MGDSEAPTSCARGAKGDVLYSGFQEQLTAEKERGEEVRMETGELGK